MKNINKILGLSFSLFGFVFAYPNLPVGVKNGVGGIINDTLYVGLGSAGDKIFSLDLNDKNARWKELSAFPDKERNQSVFGIIDNKLYVLGGFGKNDNGLTENKDGGFIYDIAKDKWTPLNTHAPRGLGGSSGAVDDKIIYVLGGVNTRIFNGYFLDIENAKTKDQKDLVASKYFDKPPKDYFFNNNVLAYDIAKNEWHNLGVTPFPGLAGAAFNINKNELYVINGEIKPGLRTKKAHLGKITKDAIKWQDLPDLIAPKGSVQDGLAGAFSGFLGDKLIVAGGANFPNSIKAFESGQNYAHKGLSKAWHKEIYALKNGKWSVIGALKGGRAYGLSVIYKNQLLLVGGEGEGGKTLDTIEVIK
ncbi:MAG: N-acetylneuraminate epimerase [Helicobacter sp.]|nr:N-acetylneuraminate epimerase [Helicobacter sp.]